MFQEKEANGRKYLHVYGYSDYECIKLIKEIERLNNFEEARIICNESVFQHLFSENEKFHFSQLNNLKYKKVGIHDVVVNDKTIERWTGYLNLQSQYGVILICSSEYGIVGIIEV
jgi:hypothetical protein